MLTEKEIADVFLKDLEILQLDELGEYDIRALYVNQREQKIIVEIGYQIDESGNPVFIFINDGFDDDSDDVV